MSGAKLFDYNSSFSVIRTNPKLTGNFRITVDSSGEVNFNSMSVNPTLSDNRFKAFNITGENSFSLDLFNFFDEGQTPYSTIFQVGEFTRGARQIVKEYSEQYDFYYASGASPLADKNYGESFSYFAPLWIKNEIPDYFVIFKVPGPIAYPYSKNYTTISSGVNYKIIKDYYSEEDFKIIYGKDPSGNDIVLANGDIFTGNSAYNTYTIISGAGKVVIYNELEYLEESNDINTLFTQKILPNLTIVKTFDIGENTKIGKYIRSIFNDPQFSKSPIDVSFGPNAYTYFNGVSVKDGIYTRKGEILSTYYSGDSSDKMMDFESYVTSGFSRNGIVCPNLLNMEFLFDDDDSDMYTINRYMGFYVSRNDMASLRLDGNAFYEYRNMPGNNDLPKPSRNSFGYYYDNTPYGVTASNGVRLFYEGASGYLPGSWDVNAATADSNKIFYLTDKYDNFYNLGRSKDLVLFDPSNNPIPDVSYGPFDPATGGFVIYGSSGATSGNVLLQDTNVDLLNFTGTDQKVGTIPGTRATSAGKAYCEIEFTKNYDLNTPLTFKIYWPNGKKKEGSKRYDIVSADDFSSSLVWVAGSYYSTGSSYYFNAKDGTYEDVATALSNLLDEVNYSTWETGVNLNSTIIRLNDSGIYGNTDYSISVFDDYASFVSLFRGNWTNSSAYSINDIVIYNGNYYQTTSNIPVPSPGSFNNNPDGAAGWTRYMTFSNPGYLKINGTDASAISNTVYFEGGTRSINTRIIFPVEYDGLVEPGYFIKTTAGYSIISSVTKYVDSPQLDTVTKKIIGFNDFTYLRVANIEESMVTSANRLNTPFTPVVELGSDNSFNTYRTPDLKIGVFTFFDSKEFDFDFWSSPYGYTPTAETYKYFQLQPNVPNTIVKNIPYVIKQGQINYAGSLYNQGNIFYGATGYTSFTDANPNLFKDLIVIPAQYSDIEYNPSISNYPRVGYNGDLDAFNGFIGIQSLTPNSLTDTSSKLQIFNRGKLDTEYEYLQENYTAERANVSRIVPFINKWAYTSGTDSRGNNYRLNVSPAFSPTNFSPSLDKNVPDARYVTHEWFLLEQPPVGFPVDQMQNQNSYLAGKIDLNKARSADPSDYLYLNSYFTVEPSDYQSQYVDNASYTKELFTPFKYNKSDGYYETLFRGVKVILKKRSNISDAYSNSADKYIPKYRGYEDYKFAAILRPIAEDDSIIQDPVRYEIIENAQQKFILLVCDVLMRDYKSLPIGYTGGTGGSPVLDYTLLYSLSNKEKLRNPLSVGEKYYEIADIKLSSALDLSLSSGSIVDTVISPGVINYIPSSTYDTDLREEIHTFFAENSIGATSGPSPTGIGSFVAPTITGSPTYPWPIGVGPSYIEFGKVATGAASYIFSISFSASNPVTVPVGPASIYRNNPVFQKSGGESYYDAILTRISAADISARINRGSKYISYKTYIWDEVNSVTVEKYDDFQLRLNKSTRIVKGKGTRITDYYGGPQTIGQYTPTGYTVQSNQNLPSTLLRYSGGYEPLFRKVIHFDKDKTDKISGYAALDLSFRNCNFAPYKLYFGISRNLQFSKVSPDSNILSLSEKLPEGPVYPLVGQSPIWKKDFNLFSSSWDPGYYQKFTGPSVYTDVAGTRSMKEYKSFFGSKIMKTPDPIDFDNYITLQISRTNGNTDVAALNNSIDSYIKSVQEISPANSGTGIGSVGPYLSGVDYDKIDPNIFPDAEIIWQYFKETNLIKGTIRLDRMLRRYLLNSGIKQVFIDNMISDFGVGSPDSINDDVNTYIDLNVSPLYIGNIFDLYVNKNGTTEGKSMDPNYMVRGDIASSDRYKMEYSNEINYKLTKNKDLIYNFEYNLESNYNYSLLFDLGITKI